VAAAAEIPLNIPAQPSHVVAALSGAIRNSRSFCLSSIWDQEFRN
jgi:hypothetical protein